MTEQINNSSPSIDDIPLEEENLNEDVPLELEEVLPTSSFETRNRELSHSAIIQSHLDGSEIVESFVNFEGETDSNALLAMKSQEKAQADSDDLQESFVDNPGTTPLEMGANASLVKEMMIEAQAAGTNVPRQVIEAASALDADPAIQAKLQGQLSMLTDVSKFADSLSGFDIAQDIAGAFIPGSILKDNFDATGNFFDSQETMRDMVVGFKSLSAEDQEAQWPVLKEHLIDALPKTRAIATMAAFLDPTGEEKLSDFSAWWAAFDTVDVAFTGFAIAKTMGKISKQLNGIKMLNELKSSREAAKVNAAAILDTTGDTAGKAGIDPMTAYNNTMPFKVEALDAAYTEGLSTKTLDNINKVKQQQFETVTDIADDAKTLREELLTPADRAKAEDDLVKEFSDDGFENVQPISRSPDSTIFSYELRSESGEVLSDTFQFDLTLKHVGTWENTENSLLPKFLSSPTVWAKGDTKDSAFQAVRLDGLSAKVGEQLRVLQQQATAPLLGKHGTGALSPNKRAQMAAIDDVLLTGDNANKMYTPTELRAGVNGTPLNDNQIEVYYNTRSLYDNLYVLRDIGERRKLVAEGMKEVNMAKHQEIGKPFKDAASARGALQASRANKVFDDVMGQVRDVNTVKVDDLYAQGKQIVSLKNPISIGKKGGEYNMIIVNKSVVKELPEKVLHPKAGYVPRINKDAYWFLKESKASMINGVTPQEPIFGKTHRYFDNKKEAQEVLAEFELKNPGKSFAIKEDREVEQQILGGSNLGAGGGLYTGTRSADPIGFGRNNLPAERFGAFEALTKNINSMQQFMTRNQWRMGQEELWINTANKLGVKVDKFDPRLVPEGTESGRFLKNMGEQIQQWNGFPAKSELYWDETVRAGSEWALNAGKNRDKVMARGLHSLHDKDPVGWARSAAFHTLLGAFNPAQYWVQAQGASIAMTLATRTDDVGGGLKVFKDQWALSFATRAKDASHVEHVAKSSGLKTKDLQEMVTLWKKTGYEESILTTADHAASLNNHGIAREALAQAADKALFFYRAGELINRRTSFLSALKNYKLDNKGRKIGDAELKEIMTTANNSMLNLTKANRAGFQKGPVSVPTQFLQVQAKMWENLLGVNDIYTKGTRAKIMAGQVAFYGMAGVPLGNMAIRAISETSGIDQAELEETNPELVNLANQGLWGGIFLSMFGADVDISQRGAIASGIQQMTADLMFNDSTMGEKIFGAFGQVPLRAFRAYGEIKPLAVAAIDGTVPIDQATMTKAISEVASLTSTWSNLRKGMFISEYNMIQDTRGKAVTTPGEVELSTGTILAQGLGFTPSISGRIRDMDTMNRALQEHRNGVTEDIVQTMWNYTKEVNTADTDQERLRIADKYDAIQKVLKSTLRTPRDHKLVNEAVERILTDKSKRSKVIKKFLDNFNDGRLADIHTWHAQLTARGLLQAMGPGAKDGE